MNLNDPIETVSSVGPIYKKRLSKLDIFSLKDLFYHFPFRYEDYSNISNIKDLKVGRKTTIRSIVFDISNYLSHKSIKITNAKLYDQTGIINAIWFNQPYLKNQLKKGEEYFFSGEVKLFKNGLNLITPTFETIYSKEQVNTARILPIYPETNGITSKWLRKQIKKLMPFCINNLPETLDDKIIRKQKLLRIQDAIEKIHFPNDNFDVEKAKKRLSFDELFQIQINSIIKRKNWENKTTSTKLKISNNEIQKFTKSLPFDLTKSQKECVSQIICDLSKKTPMNRILQGDVGSGKTIVAASAAFTVFKNNLKTLIMTPTEILAMQHYNTLTNILKPFGVRIGLVTKNKKSQNWDIAVGTHALLNIEKKSLENIGLIIIDEEHRFGVEQRSKLAIKAKHKDFCPHFLTITATPIPRTVALTLYGNLDISTINELPRGRKITKTYLVPQTKRQDAYGFIKKHVNLGEQVFIICPFVEQSETLNSVKAATVEFEKLKNQIFSKYSIGLLHGRLKSSQKERVMDDFHHKRIKILVATPVVEVGIDIPNATIMLIEGAERFGLAQLHQLRGRIGRSDKEAFCFLFCDSQSEMALKRLEALKNERDGVKLAEIDLKLRGPGEIFGTRQHGFATLKIADFFDLKLIEKTKIEAERLLKIDPMLTKHKNLKEAIDALYNQKSSLQ